MSRQYASGDEGAHEPVASDPTWQESVFVHWYDTRSEVGGVHRLGREPNRDGGRATLHSFIATGDGARFRRNDFELPLEAATTPRGFLAGGSSWHIEDGQPRLVVDEPGVQVDLRMENFYPLTDFFPSGGSLSEDFASDHYETSGSISGTVAIDGQAYQINGCCHRDHSWGSRKIMTLKSHRWISGTFGPDLSFGSIVWHSADDALVKVGYVVRDGEITYAEDVDVVTFLEPDGLTHRGGEVIWELPGGERLQLRFDTVAATVAQLHSIYYVDALCTVRHGDRIGVADFEISNNARMGTEPVGLALRATLADGLGRADD